MSRPNPHNEREAMMRCALLLVVLIFLAGCTTTVSEPQFRKIKQRAQGDTMGRTMYLGRSNGYDYFRVYHNVGNARYRLHAPNGIIYEPQPLHAPPRQIVGDPVFDWQLP